jgi:phosphatidylglycerophosphatase A
VAAFFIFRIFDVWKPFPIRYFDEHIKNGFGVMFDDILAAVYSVITIKFLAWIFYG